MQLFHTFAILFLFFDEIKWNILFLLLTDYIWRKYFNNRVFKVKKLCFTVHAPKPIFEISCGSSSDVYDRWLKNISRFSNIQSVRYFVAFAFEGKLRIRNNFRWNSVSAANELRYFHVKKLRPNPFYFPNIH